jgi:hypothetical protein
LRKNIDNLKLTGQRNLCDGKIKGGQFLNVLVQGREVEAIDIMSKCVLFIQSEAFASLLHEVFNVHLSARLQQRPTNLKQFHSLGVVKVEDCQPRRDAIKCGW